MGPSQSRPSSFSEDKRSSEHKEWESLSQNEKDQKVGCYSDGQGVWYFGGGARVVCMFSTF